MARRIYSFTPDTGAKPQFRFSLRWSIVLTVLLSLGLTALASALAPRAFASEQPSVPDDALINVVFDGANLFSPEEEKRINLHAKELLESYGVAMGVEAVSTLDGQPIESWTVDKANERGLGSSELDNGIFYAIAVDDRDFYVAKGDGYASIPDYKLQDILDGEMVPRFREGDFTGGVIESSRSFGELAVSPDASRDTRAEEASVSRAERDERWSALLLGGGITVGTIALAFGGVVGVRSIMERRRLAEEEARQLKEAELREQSRRVQAALRARRVAAMAKLSEEDWKSFAKLPNLQARTDFLAERGVYEAAFDGEQGDRQIELMERTISEERFDGAFLNPALTVEQSRKNHREKLEAERLARIEAERIRQEKLSVERDARSFWQGLSSSEKREFGRLRSDSDREQWLSDRGAGNIFGLHPAVAFALILSLSQSHVRAEESAAAAQRSSTDYSSSSFTDYSSGNMFGGGSFGGGGGAGGSW